MVRPMNESSKREIRHFQNCELRTEQDGDSDHKKLRGYAARFNSPSVEIYFFKEEIAPGAFKRTLREKPDVIALFNHDTDKVLGRTTANTLELREDEKGLYTEITPPDTTVARDLCENVRVGNIRSMSFGFRVIEDSWSKKDGKDFRTLVDVDLIEVSIVTFPAYPSTSADYRSIRSAEDIFAARPTLHKTLPLSVMQKRVALYARML